MSYRKSKVWPALFVTGALSFTAACGGDDGGSGDGKVTLRVSWWGETERHEMTEEAIKVFEKQNKDITIESEYSDWDAYYDQLTTKTAAGDAPDVFAIEIRALGEYARNGQLADLAGLVPTDDLDEKLLTSGEVDGTQYAIPTGANAFTVMANTAVFEDAGVGLPDDSSWTWEDYQSLSAEVTGSGGDIYGTQLNFNDAYLRMFAAQRGESFYEGDGLGVSAETVAAWFQTHLDMIDAKGSPSADRSNELGATDIEQSLIATNKGAMGMWWSNQLSAASVGSGEEIKLLQIPRDPSADSSEMFLQPAMFWAASSKGGNQEAAGKLIDFLVNDPRAGEILGSDRGLPMNDTVLKEIEGGLPAADKASLDFINGIRDELADPPSAYPDGAVEIPDMLERYGQEVISGQQSPEEAAQAFLDEADGALG
ncbi:ABC transporter substrate-binding protein [Streptomyces synnematoformans]|uniref:Extracellular solute-binding protein n=1 Tax=Streptomyces synnematoformans TaxID=415721 RepID=A0ABN2XMP2_9ACTN